MTFVDWLQTPQGVEVAHALILLATAAATALSAAAHHSARRSAQKIDQVVNGAGGAIPHSKTGDSPD